MSLYYQDDHVTLYHGDALEQASKLPDSSVNCIVTSPPYYGLRDYGSDGQYGLEESPAAYVETMRALFSELRRVLAEDATLWLNIGDSYSGQRGNKTPAPDNKNTAVGGGSVGRFEGKRGMVPKNLMGIPWRVAFALQDDGWILRNAIIWHKPNAMPESVTDRLSTRYEQFFMFSKSQKYWFDLDPIREEFTSQSGMANSFARKTKEAAVPGQGYKQHRHERTPPGTSPQLEATGKRHAAADPRGKNPGDMWSINTQPFGGAHFAVMPQELARRAIVAGCKPGGVVLDPFSGSGTVGLVASENGRKYVGIDISADYLELSLKTRLQTGVLDLGALA